MVTQHAEDNGAQGAQARAALQRLLEERASWQADQEQYPRLPEERDAHCLTTLLADWERLYYQQAARTQALARLAWAAWIWRAEHDGEKAPIWVRLALVSDEGKAIAADSGATVFACPRCQEPAVRRTMPLDAAADEEITEDVLRGERFVIFCLAPECSFADGGLMP
jgi:hypothetical protein